MQIKQAMSVMKAAKNPEEAIMGMMGNNPQMQQVMAIVKRHGGDPMKAFRATAEENGLDPDEILSMLG